MQYFLIFLIKFYQYFISPWLGRNCRFEPTCSAYACQAIHHHGTIKGTILAVKRILRCNPFADSGYDPVPNIRNGGSKKLSYVNKNQRSTFNS